MTDLLPVLGAAFVTGLLGSAHCFGMCAGISGLFAVSANIQALKTQVPKAIAYNVGRVLTYAVLGVIVALLGKGAVDSIPALGPPVRLASGILIILVGLQVAFNWRILAPLETAGAKIWRRIAPAARGLVPVETLPQALGLGLIWGWLPCGLVYSVLLLAATTTDATAGALVMVSFGIGTMPAMVATGVSASKIAQFMSSKRMGAGLLIIVLGIATIAHPAIKLTQSGDSMSHGNHGHMMQDEPAAGEDR